MTVTQIRTRKNLYRRFRQLSDDDAEKVMSYMDSLYDEPNEETMAALREAVKIVRDPSVKGYRDVDEMMKTILADV